MRVVAVRWREADDTEWLLDRLLRDLLADW